MSLSLLSPSWVMLNSDHTQIFSSSQFYFNMKLWYTL